MYARAVCGNDGSHWNPGRFELIAKRREGLAEVIAAELHLTLGPQEVDQFFPWMGSIGKVGEPGQQCGRFLRAEARDFAISLSHAEAAQHLDRASVTHSRCYPDES